MFIQNKDQTKTNKLHTFVLGKHSKDTLNMLESKI